MGPGRAAPSPQGLGAPMATFTKQDQVNGIRQRIAGIQKHFANVSSLTIGGVTYTVQALIQLFTALLTLLTDVMTTGDAYKVKLAAERAQAPAIRAVVHAFDTFIRGMFGN